MRTRSIEVDTHPLTTSAPLVEVELAPSVRPNESLMRTADTPDPRPFIEAVGRVGGGRTVQRARATARVSAGETKEAPRCT